MSERKRTHVLNQQRIEKVLSKGTKMKITKTILTVVLLVAFAATLTGCAAQDGGSDTKLVGWDENGPYLLKHKTNGSQVAVGKDIDAANTRFNITTQKKHQLGFVEKLAEGKTPVIADAADVSSVMTSTSTLMNNQFGIKQ